jgi:hypothetical protein
MTVHSTLDSYTTRLGSMTEPTTMWTLDAQGQVVANFTVSGSVVSVLLVDEATLREQVDRIAGEIMHWGRVHARQVRIHTIRERQLRQWKAGQEMAFRNAEQPPKGWGQGGRITGEQVAVSYRTAPEYEVVQTRVEEAQESVMVAEAIYQAFRAKLAVLTKDVRRAPDGSLQRLSP